MTNQTRRLSSLIRPHTAGTLTDAELIEVFLHRRDARAFAELVRRHGPMVWALCRRTLPGHHDAEDAFQAAFLTLARKAASISKPEHLSCWLHQVARRIAMRARQRGLQQSARESLDPDLEPLTEGDDPARRELAVLIHEELTRLPEKYRLPILLCELQGRTRREAAAELGWPEGTIAGRLSRAKQLLARRLTRRGVTLPAAALVAVRVPARLDASTARLCELALEPELISQTVNTLSQGAVNTMTKPSMKIVAWACLVGLGVGVGHFGTSGARSDEPVSPGVTSGRPDREPIDPELVLDEAIQKELRLSETQIRNLLNAWESGSAGEEDQQRSRQLAEEAEQLRQRLTELEQEQEQIAGKAHEAQKESLKGAIFENLSDQAVDRLRQITLRRMSARELLKDPGMQARLGINDEQLKKLERLPEPTRQLLLNTALARSGVVGLTFTPMIVTDRMYLTPVLVSGPGDEEVLKILTPRQREMWEKMIGEPYPRPEKDDDPDDR